MHFADKFTSHCAFCTRLILESKPGLQNIHSLNVAFLREVFNGTWIAKINFMKSEPHEIFAPVFCKLFNTNTEHGIVHFEIHGVFTPLPFTLFRAAFPSRPEYSR
jgi:hypothetical protein